MQHYIPDTTNFICRRQGCLDTALRYEEGKDYGTYIKNNSDCTLCKIKCKEDVNCGAVTCGTKKMSYPRLYGDCVWWVHGACVDDYRVYISEPRYNISNKIHGFTCYKGKNTLKYHEISTNNMNHFSKDP